MDPAKLVRMANDIGDFFASDPDRAAAMEGVAQHIKRFWEPRMRRGLYQWLDESGGEGLAPLVLAALRAHRGLVLPAPSP